MRPMVGGNIVNFDKERAARDRAVGRTLGGGSRGGGDGGPTLPQRVAVLEQRVTEVLQVLSRLEPVLARIDERLTAVEQRLGLVEQRLSTAEVRLAEVAGRVSQVPTLPQLVSVMVAVFFGSIATIGAAFAMAKFFFAQ